MPCWPWPRAKRDVKSLPMLALGEQTVRDYLNGFLFEGMASLVSKPRRGDPANSQNATPGARPVDQSGAAGRRAIPQDAGVRR